jgi:Ca-activated chloride channel family protein
MQHETPSGFLEIFRFAVGEGEIMSVILEAWDSFFFRSPALLLVMLPFLILLLAQISGKRKGGAIALTGLEELLARTRIFGTRRKLIRSMLWAAIVVGIGVLWAGPTLRSAEPILGSGSQTSYRNLLILLDISRSMSMPLGVEKYVTLPGQVRPSSDEESAAGPKKPRYIAAREALVDFVERFEGDRIGLILFSTEPFLARWPTVETDNRFVEVLEEDIGRGSVSQLQGFSSLTNIHKALDLAREVFAEQKVMKEGAVVMITDAEDDFESMGVAARNLRKDGVRLYTIGVGISEQVAKKLSREFANDPGFRIFRVDSEEELQDAYRLVGELEESPQFQINQRKFESDLRWFLSLALVVIAAVIILVLEVRFHQARAADAIKENRKETKHGLQLP